MAHTKSHVHSYADCVRVLAGKGAKRLAKALDLIDLGNKYIVRYHETDIVTYHGDGKVELNAGRWLTVTTKRHIVECSPFYVWRKRGKWYINVNGEAVEFHNGMKIATAPAAAA